MRAGIFGNVLPRAGLSGASQIAGADHWQLWEATEEHAFGEGKVHILYLDSRATWAVVSQASSETRRRLPKAPVHVVVQNSAPVAQQLQRIERECGAVSARTVRQLLQRAVARMLGASRFESEPEIEQLFVDPDVRLEDTGTPVKAMESLTRWLTDDAGSGPRVAILIAGAGIGKTTVATQLFRHLVGDGKLGRFPILVQSDHWAKLSDRASLSLWDIWRESLDVLDASTINREDFDTCVENGLFVPIFDGFDELCTRLGAHFSATETLDQLMDLVTDTDGRILLTTRDGFWADNVAADRRRDIADFELLPFNKQQTAKYLENRFRLPPEIPKREVAAKILQRLGGAAYGGDQPAPRERLTSVPLIVWLAAECADAEGAESSLSKYGGLLDAADPLEGLLMMLFERERERRRLAIDPGAQLALLTELAFDFGRTFSGQDLRLYASTHCGLDDVGPQQEALRSHVVLHHRNEDFTFRFDFLADYLAARGLTDHLLRRPTVDRRAIQLLEDQARGGSGLFERAVERLFVLRPAKWKEELSAAWVNLRAEASSQAKSGLLHLMLKAVERDVGSGPRSDRTKVLYQVLGFPEGSPLQDLHIEGTVAGLDLRGISLIGCTFESAGFAKCAFDSATKFQGCAFDGAFDVEDCEGFGQASFEECRPGPRAREVIQALQAPGVRLPVTTEQIRSTVRLALEKFQRGVGFKSLARANCRRGRIVRSPICDQVWDSLERYGVIESIRISGLPEGGVAIAEGKKGEVYSFLANAMLTGSLREAVDSLENELGARRA